MIHDFIHGIGWSMGCGFSFQIGDFLDKVLLAVQGLAHVLLGQGNGMNSVSSAFNKFTKVAMIIAGVVMLIVSSITLNQDKFSKATKTLAISVIVFTFIPVGLESLGGLMQVVTDSATSDCGDNSCDLESSFIPSLLNPNVFRVSDTGKLVDSNGKLEGEPGFDKSKVYNVIYKSSTNPSVLYTHDYSQANTNFTFDDKYLKDSIKDDNGKTPIGFNVNAVGKIDGTKRSFTYEYTNPFFMFLGFLGLFALLAFSFIKIVERILNAAWGVASGSLALVQSMLNQDEFGAVKQMFMQLFSLVLGVFMQILFYLVLGTLVGVVNKVLSPYGAIIQIPGLIGLAVFLITGPDQITKLFGIDMGVHNPITALVAGKVASTATKGAKEIGKGASKGLDKVGITGEGGLTEAITQGVGNSKVGDVGKNVGSGLSKAQNSANETAFNLARTMGGSKGEQGLDFDEQQEVNRLKKQKQQGNGAEEKPTDQTENINPKNIKKDSNEEAVTKETIAPGSTNNADDLNPTENNEETLNSDFDDDGNDKTIIPNLSKNNASDLENQEESKIITGDVSSGITEEAEVVNLAKNTQSELDTNGSIDDTTEISSEVRGESSNITDSVSNDNSHDLEPNVGEQDNNNNNIAENEIPTSSENNSVDAQENVNSSNKSNDISQNKKVTLNNDNSKANETIDSVKPTSVSNEKQVTDGTKQDVNQSETINPNKDKKVSSVVTQQKINSSAVPENKDVSINQSSENIDTNNMQKPGITSANKDMKEPNITNINNDTNNNVADLIDNE